jgi:hypothetical protein
LNENKLDSKVLEILEKYNMDRTFKEFNKKKAFELLDR